MDQSWIWTILLEIFLSVIYKGRLWASCSVHMIQKSYKWTIFLAESRTHDRCVCSKNQSTVSQSDFSSLLVQTSPSSNLVKVDVVAVWSQSITAFIHLHGCLLIGIAIKAPWRWINSYVVASPSDFNSLIVLTSKTIVSEIRINIKSKSMNHQHEFYSKQLTTS